MEHIQAVVDILEEDFEINVGYMDEHQLAGIIYRLTELRELMIKHKVEEAPTYSKI